MKKFILSFSVKFFTMLALVMSISGSVLMAAGLVATDSQGDGNASDGEVQSVNGGADGGAMTVSQGQQVAGEGGDGLYIRDVEETVEKIDTMSTPLLQISSYASNSDVDAQEFEYWSVGPRIGRTTIPAGGVTAATVNKADRFVLPIEDPGFVTKDDTIRVVSYKGFADNSNATKQGTVYLYDGTQKTVTMGDGREDLVLFVINVQEDTGYPVCVCVNGPATTSASKTNNPFRLPFDLEEGTVLIRMGKSCGELDAQTGRFQNYPEPEIQYTQNFMFQVEQSTFDKMTAKKVKWGFNDIEQAGIRDMKIAQENTYLFGKKKKIRHPNKENMNQYFTGGLWWMPAKDLTIGHQEAVKDANGDIVYVDAAGNIVAAGSAGATPLLETVIKDDDLVDFAREMFVGAAGNKKKVMLCGSMVLAKFGQIRSDRFRLKETVDVWNLTFSRFHTDFGDILVIYDEQLDMNGMSSYAFCIDPEYLKKKTFLGLTRNVLELKKAGIRNSDAVTLQEVAGIYLTFPDAHARVQLAGNDDKLDWGTAEKFDFYAAKNSVPPKKKSASKGTDGITMEDDSDVLA